MAAVRIEAIVPNKITETNVAFKVMDATNLLFDNNQVILNSDAHRFLNLPFISH